LAQNPQAMAAMAMQQAMPPKPEAYTLGPGMGRFEGNQQIAAMPPNPAAPEKDTTDAQNYATAVKGGYKGSFVEYQKEIRQAGASNINAAPSGYRLNPDGTLAFIPGGPADPANKPPNEVTQQNAELVQAVTNADKRIKDYESKGLTDTSNKTQAALDSNPITATFTNDDYRKYKAAAMEWTSNLLYLKSGKQAPPGEVQKQWQTYFPQPGDSADVRKTKADMRQGELANARGLLGGKQSGGASGGWSITPVQ
jgi:hypothetical protein